MNTIIGCDAHRRYALFAVLDTHTLSVVQTRVNYQPGASREFLSDCPEGTPVTLETVSNDDWIAKEIEDAARIQPSGFSRKWKHARILPFINRAPSNSREGAPNLCPQRHVSP